MLTRRQAANALLAPAFALPGARAAAPDELVIEDAALREQLAAEGKRAVQQAACLRDLPLEGIAPGFVFRPD